MEPPPAPPISAAVTPPTAVPSTTTTATTTTAATYPDSTSSSPRSRATDFDDTFPPTSTGKLRLLCSYGGHIVPRPHDKSLCYVGGDTRIVVVDRSATMQDLFSRLSKTLLNNRPFTLKYQLPNEDLDSLISVSTEEDLDNMVDEYDRSKPGRIRLFLFPSKPEGSSSVGSILEGSNRSEDWFLNALNGVEALQRGFSDPASVNCLLGLNDGGGNGNNSSAKEDSFEGEKLGKLGNQNQSNQDIQSVPDSPIIETTSSFGSTSSANLAPIRVHVDDGGTGGRVLEQRVGIEEQFAQMGIGVQKQMDGHGGFVMASQPTTLMPAPAPATGVPAAAMGGVGGGGGEFTDRVISDDERSDHGGVPVGYRKQQLSQQTIWQPVTQQKQMGSGELPSPDSVSSDSSFSTAFSRQKQVMYQDPVAQLSSGSNRLPQNMIDPNTRIQLQQVSETGYALHPQYEQHQQQLLQQQQQQQQQQLLQQQQHQLLQQQQQQHLQQQQGQTQPQAQQYIPAGAQFVHHSPAGAVPMSNYYQMYPPQQPQHHPHQYPVYYVPAGQAQAYSLPVQHQPNPGETPNPIPSTHPQNPPNPTIITTSSAYTQARNVPAPKPEMYRTAAGPQLVQVPSSQPQSQHQQQQQFVGYSQIHHQSQSMAPNSASNAGYAYEFADPAHAQLYYTQSVAPTLAAQYQAVTSGSTMVLPDETNLKQQIRSSQPL